MRGLVSVAAAAAVAACGQGGVDEPIGVDTPPAARPDPGHNATGSGELAFVDVSVATMESPVLAAHQTVVIDHGSVVALGPVDRVTVPVGAKTIDGRGKYLIPGLHDMHVHLDGTRSMLELFVTAGVTTVRNMAGSARVLATRDKIRRGELLGPTIYTAGPFVDGSRPRWEASRSVTNAVEAEAVVSELATGGYDFLKIYNGLSREAYDAIVASAAAHHLRLVGHVPFAVGLEHVLASGQASIEHLMGYAEAIERDDSPLRHHHDTTSTIKRWMFADSGKLAEVAAATARAGTWNCPTLVTAVTYSELWRGHVPDAELDDVSPDWRARWDPKKSPRHVLARVRAAAEVAHGPQLDTELALVRELSAAGAPLLAGTDTPNPYVVPGQSLHHELELFAQAGLSPYEALRAATIDAGDFLGDPHDGRIAVGAHADLVLLGADPFADLRALDKIDGVMVHGEWLGEDRLHAIHDELVALYGAPPYLQPIELGELAGGARVVRYDVGDNSVVIGAYAMARVPGGLVEQETAEDDVVTTHTTLTPGHHAIALDFTRPEGTSHVEYAGKHELLVGAITPATAMWIVAPLTIDAGEKLTLAIAEPDPDAPEVLLHGSLTVTRLDDPSDTERAYQLRLSIDKGAWAGRVVVDSNGVPEMLRLGPVSRPLLRTWRRVQAPKPASAG